MMDPNDWQRVKTVFHAAVELKPQRRAGYVAKTCGDDPVIRAEVESLLEAHTDGESFIDPPDFKSVSHFVRESKSEAMVGQRVGPYELVRLIGSGGMANVYLAHRVDGQFTRQVAVKLIKQGMDTDELLRRFQRERQTLAGLDHPNIAKLIDGGATEEGRPYLIMEYVEGVPIDQYCDRKSLSIADRLTLFRTVCAAVHYAHQNLVVHRDLKPANILVAYGGVPKLLDFGIAKLLDPDADLTMSVSGPAAIRLMTPDYASPEQVMRERISTATDVYSLGIILYELLTGHRPYRLNGHSQRRLEAVICEEEPQKPSTAVTLVEEIPTKDDTGSSTVTPETVSATRGGPPESIRRRLAGDLDNVVLKAIRKEPHRRYASAQQLSDDIRRHLTGLPVMARKDTAGYRAGKFIKRNKVGAAAAVLVVLSLVIGLAGTVWQARLVTRERDLAQANLLRAQAAESQAGAEAERAKKEADTSAAVTQFLVELFKVSDPDESLGETITAREILDRGAERIESELQDQPHIRVELLDTIGKVYQNLGAYDRAAGFLQEALALSRRHLGDSLETATRLNDLAVLRQAQGDYPAAEALHQEAYAMWRKLLPEDHVDLAISLSNLGSLARDQGDFDKAERLLSQALEIRREAYGEEHERVVASLNNLSGVQYAKGDYAAAEQSLREVLRLSRKINGNVSTNVARFVSNLGLVLHMRGAYDAAEAYYQEAYTTRRTLLGPGHPDVANSLNNLGGLHMDKGDPVSAEPFFRQALEIYQAMNGDAHPSTANALNNLGLSLRRQQRFEDAQPLLQEALNQRRRVYPAGHPAISKSLLELGELFRQTGKLEEAEGMIRESLQIRLNSLPSGHWLIAEAKSVLGGCLASRGRFSEAEPFLVESYPVISAARGEHNSRTRDALDRIIHFYLAWGDPQKAATWQARLDDPPSEHK